MNAWTVLLHLETATGQPVAVAIAGSSHFDRSQKCEPRTASDSMLSLQVQFLGGICSGNISDSMKMVWEAVPGSRLIVVKH